VPQKSLFKKFKKSLMNPTLSKASAKI